MANEERLFSVTISAKRKPGMDEAAYHKYISQTHAGHLKNLFVQNKIVDYTMVRSATNCQNLGPANRRTPRSNTTRLS
jgi:hypothetical protein